MSEEVFDEVKFTEIENFAKEHGLKLESVKFISPTHMTGVNYFEIQIVKYLYPKNDEEWKEVRWEAKVKMERFSHLGNLSTTFYGTNFQELSKYITNFSNLVKEGKIRFNGEV